MKNLISGTFFVLIALLSGCSTVAPEYSGSRKNVEAIKNLGDIKIAVGKFSDAENQDNKKQLSMRANTLTSPYGPTFASYIENAVRKELVLSGNFSDKSKITVSGILHKNNIDVSGFNIGSGICEVEFNVTKDALVVLNKKINQGHQWESSFVAAVAIPKAINEYSVLIEKLLNNLFTDREFIKAVGGAGLR
jgi:hypothetical protein